METTALTSTAAPTAAPTALAPLLRALEAAGEPAFLRRPWLPVPPAHDRATWALPGGSCDQEALTAFVTGARRDATGPWAPTSARAYARFHRDGNRTEYEAAVAARQRRLSRAAVAAAATLDPGLLDEAADGALLLCEQSSWCWPAHDDTRALHRSVLPTPSAPFLDLGAGEVAAQLAWVDRLLGDQLEESYPGLRRRLREEVHHRVLAPYLTRRDWHWLGLDGDVHNWNPWVLGNVLVAALQLAGTPGERLALCRLVLRDLDRYVSALPRDGAVDEGFAYWWNGACRALEALDLLDRASGGLLDWTVVPQLRATVAFPHRMHLGRRWHLNVADSTAQAGPDLPWHALHRAARRAGDDEAATYARSQRDTPAALAQHGAGLGRLLGALTDGGWNSAPAAPPPLPREVWLPSVQILLARTTQGSSRGLTMTVKGGHNGEHHNHCDVGSLTVALDGVPVVVDPGRPTYDAHTFGPRRYERWPMQSTFHSVPAPGGGQQGVGERFAASQVRTCCQEQRVQVRLQLAGAYPDGQVTAWERTVQLDRALGQVQLTDRWELPGETGQARVHLMLAGRVHLRAQGAVVETLGHGGALEVTWDDACTAHLDDVPLDDPMLAEDWGERLTRLVLRSPASVGGLRTTFRRSA